MGRLGKWDEVEKKRRVTQEDINWILSGPANAGILDSDWMNILDGTNVNIVTDPTRNWVGRASTDNVQVDLESLTQYAINSGEYKTIVKPFKLSINNINELINYSGSVAGILARQQALIDNDYANRNSLDAWYSVTWFDTIGVEYIGPTWAGSWSNYRGLDGNEVVMIVTLNDGYTVQADSNPLLVDINSRMTTGSYGDYAPQAAGLPIINSSINFDEQIIINNSSNVTITNTSNHTITQETLDGGFKNQSEKIQITGNCTNGGVIATIKIEANDNYYLSKKPSLILDLDPKINMIVKSKTKSTNSAKKTISDFEKKYRSKK